ncbi:MAG: multidrug resistance protein [Gammaproteobacteria bacterium]|jgi:DHA2 family multidrug resistance protein|nr:multidrug resistance protein [Gammaproteobacteria bacterium]
MDNIDQETYQNRWLITATIMIVTVIEILDSTIVNVSLPNMMGSLNANVDEITWVLTSYIVSAAVVMPLTGFLVKRLGRRRLLLINILGFMTSSMLCGIASNLPEIVSFRILQGVFGASLVPLSQFILRDTFPKKEQGMAMAIWGIGIMAAPILGPTIGGFITQHLNWRWVFYINFPVCAIAYIMTMKLIKETPTEQQPIDWLGMLLMSIGIGALQVLLDRGNSVGWFEASSIRWQFTAALIGIIGFIWRSLSIEHPVVNLKVFRDRNFCLSTWLVMLFVMMLMGQIILSPLMLQTLLNYPSTTAGLAMAPRGIASIFAMAIAGRLISLIDSRWLISFGILCGLYGTYLMAKLNLDMGYHPYFIASIFQGIGIGFFFVPLSTLSLANLAPAEIAGAAGIWGLSRNLGQSLGISIMATLLSRMGQTNWNTLSGYIHPYNTNLILWQQATGRTWHDPVTMQLLAQQVQNQAQMIAFNDIAWLASIALALSIPFVFLLQQPKYLAKPMEMH